MKLEKLKKGTAALTNSKKIQRVVEVVLKLGNYLNGGTRRGGLFGFKIDALKKLNTVKTNDNKRNLLHWIAEYFEENENVKELYDFDAEIDDIGEAAGVQLSLIDTDFRIIKNELKVWDNVCGFHFNALKSITRKQLVDASPLRRTLKPDALCAKPKLFKYFDLKTLNVSRLDCMSSDLIFKMEKSFYFQY